MKLLLLFLLLMFTGCGTSAPGTADASPIDIERVEPEFWWTDFEETELQVLVYGEDIGKSRVSLDHSDIELKRVVQVENPNYLFVYLDLEEASPGTFELTFNKNGETYAHEYELKQRYEGDSRNQGFDASEVIYLIMPDRFANGDPSIDEVEGMIEGVDRDEPFARHGGDLQGIQDNLDYIEDLGMTAIWLNPALENDMPYDYDQQIGFYHGYAATDMYKIDRRYGTNEQFRELVDDVHSRGMKFIMDMIHNHVGTHHWFIKDMPTEDWVHDREDYGLTNYRTNVLMDPYSSEDDYNSLVKAWFVDEMPDLNQENPLVADYLIQNTLWWIEYSGIDGIRMDTHPYPYKEYMAEWSRRVLEEYPDFNIVGEVWMPNVPTTAYWQTGFPSDDGYESHLPSVTDFPLYSAITAGIHEEGGWDTGMNRVYLTLGQDFLYTDPLDNVIFVDNHDLDRFFSVTGEDYDRFRLGLTLIMTTRGIPQIYYGTEILKKGAGPDAEKRRDFPGGWEEDPINAFTEEGRVELGEERNLPVTDAHEFVTSLTHWRNNTPVVQNGEKTHFVANDNVYVYFRHNEDNVVMVVLNGNDDSITIETDRYSEFLDDFSSGQDIISGERITNLDQLELDRFQPMVIELD